MTLRAAMSGLACCSFCSSSEQSRNDEHSAAYGDCSTVIEMMYLLSTATKWIRRTPNNPGWFSAHHPSTRSSSPRSPHRTAAPAAHRTVVRHPATMQTNFLPLLGYDKWNNAEKTEQTSRTMQRQQSRRQVERRDNRTRNIVFLLTLSDKPMKWKLNDANAPRLGRAIQT